MQARIYRRPKSTMQSGRAGVSDWVLEYELTSPRRPEPLMGWTAADDTLNQVSLRFPTKETAVAFAERKSLDYAIEAEQERRITPRNYADNFKPRPR